MKNVKTYFNYAKKVPILSNMDNFEYKSTQNYVINYVKLSQTINAPLVKLHAIEHPIRMISQSEYGIEYEHECKF